MSTTSVLVSPPSTPRKRRERPYQRKQNISLSPRKLRVQPPTVDFSKVRASSDSLFERPPPNTLVDRSEIEFQFSFYDVQKRVYTTPSPEQFEHLETFLIAQYAMVSYRVQEPYLLLWTSNVVPEEEHRPFLIAGLIVVWMQNDHFNPGFSTIGTPADGIGLQIGNAGFIQKLKSPQSTFNDIDLRYLKNSFFPAAIGISFTPLEITIQLHRQTDELFKDLLQILPSYIEGCPIPRLRYMNGLLNDNLGESFGRVTVPKLGAFDDKHDYLADDKILCPGLCLQGPDGFFTAGIFVKRGHHQIRLLVPFHCFRSQAHRLNDNRYCWIKHAGNVIGVVESRVANTDFALAKINNDITPSNKFMEIESVAQEFVQNFSLKHGQYVIIDSFVASTHKLMLWGRQFVTEQTESRDIAGKTLRAEYPFRTMQGEFVAAGEYTTYYQEVVTTGSPSFRHNRTVQEGACGSALVLCGENGERREKEGKICGQIHWSNIREKHKTTDVLIGLADAPNALIKENWAVADFGETLDDVF